MRGEIVTKEQARAYIGKLPFRQAIRFTRTLEVEGLTARLISELADAVARQEADEEQRRKAEEKRKEERAEERAERDTKLVEERERRSAARFHELEQLREKNAKERAKHANLTLKNIATMARLSGSLKKRHLAPEPLADAIAVLPADSQGWLRERLESEGPSKELGEEILTALTAFIHSPDMSDGDID